MCMYNPPLLLAAPELSAAVICAVPLFLSVRRWSDVVSASVGVLIALLAAVWFVSLLQTGYLNFGILPDVPPPVSTTNTGPGLTPGNCMFPPLGDGLQGYSWLAALCIFEMILASGISNAINRRIRGSVGR